MGSLEDDDEFQECVGEEYIASFNQDTGSQLEKSSGEGANRRSKEILS